MRDESTKELVLSAVPFPVVLLEDPVTAKWTKGELWLYLGLRALASPLKGQYELDVRALASTLKTTTASIGGRLGRLRAQGLIGIRRGKGRVIVTICHWRRADRSIADHAAVVGSRTEPLNVPSTIAQRIAISLNDEGSLGRYEHLCEAFDREVIERALRDALAMPQDRIRKSRGALFTYLTRKYDQEKNQY